MEAGQNKMLNQAIFSRLWVEEDGRITPEFTKPFNMIAEPVKNEISYFNEQIRGANAHTDLSHISSISNHLSKIFSHSWIRVLLVDLTGLDSNNYQSILRFKHQISKKKAMCVHHAIQKNVSSPHMIVDGFGELAVKTIQQNRPQFTPEEIQTMKTAYDAGETTITLAKQFKCSKGTINKTLRNNGVEITRKKSYSKLNVNQVISMYGELKTAKEIANVFGVSEFIIRQCLKDNNIPRRSRWDYPQK